MADTAKKTKTATKPRATTTKTATKTAPAKETAAKVSKPTREQIERLAKTYWEARGRVDGYAEQDWARAEKELLNGASAKKAS
ncbi:MAG: DUF2934 domain-containing protein [Terracidiphilus sp.]